MKKILLFLLLLVPALINAQKVEYYPKRELNWNQIRQEGFSTLAAENIPAGQKLKLVIAIHGAGERSGGTIKNLENLVLGFDNNGDGIRETFFVTDDMKKAVNQYGLLLIIPTYEDKTFFEPAQINYLYNWAQANYSLHPKMLLTGFSYGGGAVVKYITSNIENANRVAYAIPCAATNHLVTASIPGLAGVAVHAFSNDDDPTVDEVNTTNIVNSINASNPALKAIKTFFRKRDHGSDKEAWSLTPPKAPGGQGFIDAAENIYQVFDDIIATGVPRQMKSGAVIPSISLVANFNLSNEQVIDKNYFDLDASSSTGVRTDWQGYAWDVSPAEGGSWNARPEGGMYGGPVKKLIALTTGKYTIKLTVRDAAGKTASKTAIATVNLSTAKFLISFDSDTDLITYSDGSTEKGFAVFAGGKWTVKNSAGQVIF